MTSQLFSLCLGSCVEQISDGFSEPTCTLEQPACVPMRTVVTVDERGALYINWLLGPSNSTSVQSNDFPPT